MKTMRANTQVEPEVLKLIGVPPTKANLVSVFDRAQVGDASLELVHYLDAKVIDPEVSHVRGIIVAHSGTERKIVCKSFPFTPEVVLDDFSKPALKKIIEADDKVVCQSAPEGVIVRIFSHLGRWFLSTHKKIDGRNSRWESPPFGVMFLDVLGIKSLDDLNGILSPKFCYVFLMCHPHHTHIRHNSTKSLTCVAAYDMEDGMKDVQVSDYLRVFKDDVREEPKNFLLHQRGDWKCIEICHPNVKVPDARFFDDSFTFDDFLELFTDGSLDNLSGVIIRSKDAIVKVITADYERKRILRGNEPNRYIRYVDLILRSKPEQIKDFAAMFPDDAENFAVIDYAFEVMFNKNRRCINSLYHDFEFRHVNGNYLRVNQMRHLFLMAIHEEDRSVTGRFLSEDDKQNIKNRMWRKLKASPAKDVYDMLFS